VTVIVKVQRSCFDIVLHLLCRIVSSPNPISVKIDVSKLAFVNSKWVIKDHMFQGMTGLEILGNIKLEMKEPDPPRFFKWTHNHKVHFMDEASMFVNACQVSSWVSKFEIARTLLLGGEVCNGTEGIWDPFSTSFFYKWGGFSDMLGPSVPRRSIAQLAAKTREGRATS
jgi:hypothetical protein